MAHRLELLLVLVALLAIFNVGVVVVVIVAASGMDETGSSVSDVARCSLVYSYRWVSTHLKKYGNGIMIMCVSTKYQQEKQNNMGQSQNVPFQVSNWLHTVKALNNLHVDSCIRLIVETFHPNDPQSAWT